MATQFITGADILAHAGVSAPTPDDEQWAQDCASAVCDQTEIAMGHVVGVDQDTTEWRLLRRAGLQDGALAYTGRDTPSGIVSMGSEGDVARVSADILRAVRVVIREMHGPGIG